MTMMSFNIDNRILFTILSFCFKHGDEKSVYLNSYHPYSEECVHWYPTVRVFTII